MSFLAWYSFYRNIPEAKVAVACNRLLMKHQLFDWAKRCDVPLAIRKSDTPLSHAKYFLEKGILSFPLLILTTPDIVAVRELANASIFDKSFSVPKAIFLTEMTEPVERYGQSVIFDVKGKDFETFMTYENGWGKFVTSSWINKEIHPITPLWKYEEADMSANERRLAELWKDFTPLFLAVRG
jgi:hypothetical protein